MNNKDIRSFVDKVARDDPKFFNELSVIGRGGVIMSDKGIEMVLSKYKKDGAFLEKAKSITRRSKK